MKGMVLMLLSNITDLIVPEEWYEDVYFCVSIRPAYEYVNKQKTDNLIGYRYRVKSTVLQDEFSVLIYGNEPLLQPEDLPNGSMIQVTFDNLRLSPYINVYKGFATLMIRGEASDVEIAV